jgi:hypothetical protein
MLSLSLLVLLACPSAEPTSHEACASLSGAARDDCYTRTLPVVFCTDVDAGVKLVEDQVADPVVRDFIWLEVTTKVAPQTPRWCERIADSALKERCITVVRRPHLHRDVASSLCGERTGGPGAGGPSGPPPRSPAGGPSPR